MRSYARLDLTDTEWVDLLDPSEPRAANAERRVTLTRCCANIADLRDACFRLLNDPTNAWLSLDNFVRALGFALAGHDELTKIVGITKIVQAFEIDLEKLRQIGHDQIKHGGL